MLEIYTKKAAKYVVKKRKERNYVNYERDKCVYNNNNNICVCTFEYINSMLTRVLIVFKFAFYTVTCIFSWIGPSQVILNLQNLYSKIPSKFATAIYCNNTLIIVLQVQYESVLELGETSYIVVTSFTVKIQNVYSTEHNQINNVSSNFTFERVRLLVTVTKKKRFLIKRVFCSSQQLS